ncbi:unnamed protein product [Schistosoma curassoni]|uniref:Reverse transcriptase domain-containing protein n=1 Tax=Schistosoma curassoni TaxID=6186 RepID=A0A183JYU3_9TREM|nr:unnamed protein product [Schistosoma curassoni]
MKQLYDTTKKLTGIYSKQERSVKDKEGKPITEIQLQRNRWMEHFEELLNRPASMNPPDIEAAMRQPYDTKKKLAKKYSKPERPLKDKEGKPITGIQGQENGWVEHFEELLNRPTPLNPPDIKAASTNLIVVVTSTAIKKIRMATRQIKSGKAA